MQSSTLLSIGATGFAVSFVHSILPTHWLPFVLASRAQKWSHGKTLSIVAVAGGGHTLFTVGLGLVVLGLGVTVEHWTGQIFPWVVGFALAGFGSYYFLRPAGGHHHHHGGHHPHGHDHDHDETHEHPHVLSAYHPAPAKSRTDRAVIGGLIGMLALSPCEAFLPVYLSGVSLGWGGFVALSAVLLVGCVAGMLAFTALGLIGIQRLKLEALEHHEDRIVGALLLLLAVLVIALER